MKGTDTRVIPDHSLADIAGLIKEDPFSNSFLIYNQRETVGKLKSWTKALPWITPFYAIKSNPIKPLL
jgi:diaminopimelate decarboxylase